MPFPSDTKYPAIATNAAWQKKKSLIDKSTKTKVGPALVTAEAKWNTIKFDDLNAAKMSKTPGAAQAALDKAEAAWPAVVAARQALKAAWTVADTQAGNSKLSSASQTALKAIAKALKDADKRLDLMDDAIPAFKVDVRNATEAAMATLSNLEVKLGSKIVAHAKSAKLASNKTYEVKDITWHMPTKMTLDLLQKKVSVSAHDGSGRLVNMDLKIAGITGDDMMRLA